MNKVLLLMMMMVTTEPDAELVQRARSGDRQAFGTLLSRHQPLLRAMCQRVLGRGDALEDVAQETALQAWLALGHLRDARQFGPWLAGIGLNVARRQRRAAAESAWSWDAMLGGGLVAEPLDDGPDPQELVEAAELSRVVRNAVAELPSGQRAAVLLVYLAGLTYRETAAALGVEVGAVRTRLHKGRQSLSQRLRQLLQEDVMAVTSVEQQMLEMKVADVRRVRDAQEAPPRSVVIMEEVGGSRRLPIWVGQWEGDSIAMLLEKVKVPRPLTHAFTASLLRAGGVQVKQVQVHRLVDETYYARVLVSGAAGESAVDARPSDCIALALEVGARMYAAADVLEAAEAFWSARQQSSNTLPPTIGAAEIVTHLIEHWPREPRPTR